jgi:hypothetical protein
MRTTISQLLLGTDTQVFRYKMQIKCRLLGKICRKYIQHTIFACTVPCSNSSRCFSTLINRKDQTQLHSQPIMGPSQSIYRPMEFPIRTFCSKNSRYGESIHLMLEPPMLPFSSTRIKSSIRATVLPTKPAAGSENVERGSEITDVGPGQTFALRDSAGNEAFSNCEYHGVENTGAYSINIKRVSKRFATHQKLH